MALTASINITVAPLPEDDVWFANSQAWTNYWRDVNGTVSLDPATTTVYTSYAYNSALPVCDILVDDIPYKLVTKDMFDSLMARVDHLNTTFELMRNQLKLAGFITEAQ